MIPSLMNQFISSSKDTAILSAISVNEVDNDCQNHYCKKLQSL